MQIVVTHHGAEREVDVVAERPDATLGDLLAAACAPAGAVTGAVVDGRWHPADRLVDDAALYCGAHLVVTTTDDPGPGDRTGDHPGAGRDVASRPASHGGAAGTGTGAVLAVVGGPDAGAAVPLDRPLVVGRDPGCDVVVADPTVSARHLRLEPAAGGGAVAVDLGSHNGTAVDDVAALPGEPVAVPAGAAVRLGRTELQLRHHDGGDRPRGLGARAASGGVVPFNRPPRPAPPAGPADLALPEAPDESDDRRTPFNVLAVLAPLGLAGGMVALYGSWRYALFGLLSPVMAVGTWIGATRRRGRARRGAARAYRDAVAALAAGLDAVATAEAARLRDATPDAAEVVRRALLPSVALWERRPGHAGFLRLRAGTGDVAWRVPVAGPSPGATSATGGMAPEVAEVVGRHAVIPDAPVVLDLADGPVGLVGDRAAALALARSLVCQAAVHHGPADVPVVVLAAPGREPDWAWAAWLPHTLAPDGTGRTLAAGEPATTALLDALRAAAPAPDPLRRGRPRPGAGRDDDGPVRLYVVDDLRLLEGRPAPLRDLLRGAAGPATAIVVAPTEDRLPALCATVVTLTAEGGTTVRRPATGEVVSDVAVTGYAVTTARSCARALARFEDPEAAAAGGMLPPLVRLPAALALPPPGDAWGAAIAARWDDAGLVPRLTAPLGTGVGGTFAVDLVADGPHALVAGTTGAGKSELLRTWVAGLAASVGPEHLTFVLVDYKGGSAFDACARLPHVVGLVTDLDEHLGARALRSLEAELRHRERLLREAGAADLPSYLVAGARLGPLPRLVVVVDEFATLATDLPDFLGALVGIAQRGRSLGVHLVLATQRPRGAVNAAIRANTNLRIALRVQEPAESADVIDVPHAATIGRTTPGRAYVRRGAGEVEVVQTALATTTPAPGGGVRVTPVGFGPVTTPAPTGPPGRSGDTDLSRLVAATCAAVAATGRAHPRRPWLPMLPPDLPLAAVGGTAGLDGLVAFARGDDPDHQRTVPLGWDPAEGHLALHGMVGSGTTTAAVATVLALCAARSPDACHVYGIDYGGGGLAPLAGLPHVGAIVGAGEREAQGRLVRRFRTELDRRRDLGPERLAAEPLLVAVVDGAGAFLAEHEGIESVEVMESVRRLVADGPAVRIVLVLVTDRVGALPLRMASSIAQRVLFRLADPNEFAAVGLRPRQLPVFVPGRAVHGPSGLVAQVGHPGDVAAAVARIAAATPPAAGPPAPIRTLPTLVRAGGLPAAQRDGARLVLPVGVAEEDLAPVALTLAPGEHALVAGGPQAGASTALALLARQARAADPDAVLVGVCDEDAPLFASDALDAAGPADELADLLARAAAHHRRWVVLVDDAPRVEDPGGVLAAMLAGRRPGLHVVAGGRVDELRRALAHWSRPVRSSRTGLLVGPDLAVDGDVLGLRLPRRVPVRMTAGRGFVVQAGRARLAQIALPEVARRPGTVPTAVPTAVPAPRS